MNRRQRPWQTSSMVMEPMAAPFAAPYFHDEPKTSPSRPRQVPVPYWKPRYRASKKWLRSNGLPLLIGGGIGFTTRLAMKTLFAMAAVHVATPAVLVVGGAVATSMAAGALSKVAVAYYYQRRLPAREAGWARRAAKQGAVSGLIGGAVGAGLAQVVLMAVDTITTSLYEKFSSFVPLFAPSVPANPPLELTLPAESSELAPVTELDPSLAPHAPEVTSSPLPLASTAATDASGNPVPPVTSEPLPPISAPPTGATPSLPVPSPGETAINSFHTFIASDTFNKLPPQVRKLGMQAIQLDNPRLIERFLKDSSFWLMNHHGNGPATRVLGAQLVQLGNDMAEAFHSHGTIVDMLRRDEGWLHLYGKNDVAKNFDVAHDLAQRAGRIGRPLLREITRQAAMHKAG